jgi:hypothetical protein
MMGLFQTQQQVVVHMHLTHIKLKEKKCERGAVILPGPGERESNFVCVLPLIENAGAVDLNVRS